MALSTRRRTELAFFLVAICLYLPGIGWGIPPSLVGDRTHPWGPDEIADAALSQIHTVIARTGRYNPQYPLFGYLVQALPIAPYVLVAGRLSEGDAIQRGRVLRVQTILARSTSVLLGAALVVVAVETFAVLWSGAHAWIAGALTLLLYPMFYYGRTSNVDLAALFFTAVALWLCAVALKRGLDRTTAILIGTFAALGIATKDASYGALLPAGGVIAFLHWRTHKRLVLLAAGTAVGVYLVASGLLLNWDWYFRHIAFIRTGSRRHYTFYYGSTRSYPAVLGDTVRLILDAMSVPVALAAVPGLWLAVRRQRALWLWTLPAIGIVVLTVLPVRFVLYRFIMIPAYCLTFLAAVCFSIILARRPLLGRIAIAVACGWSLLRGADLTSQMLRDSRYAAAVWLETNARPGDRLGYYGTEPSKLPFVDARMTLVPGPDQLPAAGGPEFLLVMPWQAYETVHEYNLPDETYATLRGGTGGYHQLLGLKSAALFPTRPGSSVNPEVKVFVRDDRIPSLVDATPSIVTTE